MSEATSSAIDWVRKHTDEYLASGGKRGHRWRGVDTLLLTTTGRRSGQKRRTALIYRQEGDDYLVVASYGGRPKHPDWYQNLLASPKVEVQVKDEVFTAEARPADEQERARLWPLMTAIWPDYDTYQTKTDRQIPVVILTPQR
jgi:deazaflavin-dependent oxidoreductase (nitroreductase family)